MPKKQILEMVSEEGLVPASGDLIAGVGRALAVIEAFNDEYSRVSVAQVSRLTNIPRTAVRRYLFSLCHYGYAETDGKWYWLTPRVLRLGQSYLEGARLPRLVQPFIQRLSISTGETVNLSTLDGHELVYLARSNTAGVVSIGFYPGARIPAHVASPGPVILSTMQDDQVQQWVKNHDFVAFTSNSADITPTIFSEQVKAARKQDYWISVGQLDLGFSGVAVPLRDRHGGCKGAISMTLQSSNWPEEKIVSKLLPVLNETTKTLRTLI
jgi:IclR family pca regulon transcriptional regulator